MAQELKEGIHYYIESGKYVFTERYHLERGYCCVSGCRHCPYEDKSSKQQKQSKQDMTLKENKNRKK